MNEDFIKGFPGWVLCRGQFKPPIPIPLPSAIYKGICFPRHLDLAIGSLETTARKWKTLEKKGGYGKDLVRSGVAGMSSPMGAHKENKTVLTLPQISDPRVRFWDADFRSPRGGSPIWTVPAMQNKEKWLKIEGGHLLGRSFRAPPGGQLFGNGYASGHGSLIRGGLFYWLGGYVQGEKPRNTKIFTDIRKIYAKYAQP